MNNLLYSNTIINLNFCYFMPDKFILEIISSIVVFIENDSFKRKDNEANFAK